MSKLLKYPSGTGKLLMIYEGCRAVSSKKMHVAQLNVICLLLFLLRKLNIKIQPNPITFNYVCKALYFMIQIEQNDQITER
jgi:hypothetical protein